MPRKPTGRPIGRPVGSGTLGAQARLTIRIPLPLLDRLEAYAAGRSYTRGAPQLARCIREAIEHYLVCPNKRQTGIAPASRVDANGQTINETRQPEEHKWQTESVPALEATAGAARKAALVARLRQMQAAGMSLQKMATQLQVERLPTLSGRGQWTKGSVDKLLRAN